MKTTLQAIATFTRLALLLLLLNLISVTSASAQLVSGTTYTIDNTASGAALFPTGTSFNSFGSAITALNATTAGTISSNTTFNVVAGQVFNETPNTVINYLNTNGSNPVITFQRSGAGANPIWQAVGVSNVAPFDTLLIIRSGDYYTFDGIDFRNNPTNSGGTQDIEAAIRLVGSANNGCKNNTFKNLTITLDKTNPNNTVCINTIANLAGVTTVAGTSDFNSFINLKLQNAMNGYNFIGKSAAIPDLNNTINNSAGGRSEITNIGPSSVNSTVTTYNGVIATQQKNFTVNNTNLNNFTHYNNAAGAGTINGINVASNVALGTASFDHDTLTNWSVTTGSTGSASMTAITVGGSPATLNVTNNRITNFSTASTTASISSSNIIQNGGKPTTALHIDNNFIDNIKSLLTGGGGFVIFNLNGLGLFATLSGNTVSNIDNSGPGASSGITGIGESPVLSTTTDTVTICNKVSPL